MNFEIFSDHFVSVGAISAGDGSQYDFIRAMDHYNKLLMGTGLNNVLFGIRLSKFMSRPSEVRS